MPLNEETKPIFNSKSSISQSSIYTKMVSTIINDEIFLFDPDVIK